MKKSLIIYIILNLLVACKSNVPKESVAIEKGEGNVSTLKKVSVTPIWKAYSKSFASDRDISLIALQGTIESKIVELHKGEEVAGGKTLLDVIKKLNLERKFNKAILEITDSNGKTLSQESVETLKIICDRTKIDGIAVPMVFNEERNLESGNAISIGIQTWNGKTGTLAYVGRLNDVKISEKDYSQLSGNPDQLKGKANTVLIQAGIDLMDQVKKEAFGGSGFAFGSSGSSSSEKSSESQAKASTTEGEGSEKSDAPKTPLEKYGPPTLFGTIVALFFILP